MRNVRTELQRTPDLAAVVNQIIDQPGWAQGNPMVILVTGTSTSRLIADSFEGGTAGRPVLHIEYFT